MNSSKLHSAESDMADSGERRERAGLMVMWRSSSKTQHSQWGKLIIVSYSVLTCVLILQLCSD